MRDALSRQQIGDADAFVKAQNAPASRLIFRSATLSIFQHPYDSDSEAQCDLD
jgi:hypothetical protein